ncbi:hypothetical protein PT287_09170 [Lactobacillus sp. ESL0679]|uniref:hypothetical protein n=1 Tax=Lactobacillus sp. ESL0679 TaxID=2983209 RepID=UPI0023F885AB|nr:hypothetical protein [Lactobacillus sp. ESL0679]MDF7683666.1 hypothetical protein [Lactobacillus sp. ESL0679]
MRLTDLLQLTNDLSEQTTFYLTIEQKVLPLARLKITASECLLYPGQMPMTKVKIFHLVKHMHGRSIPLWVQNGNKRLPLYGVQILPETNSVRLT